MMVLIFNYYSSYTIMILDGKYAKAIYFVT